MFLEDIFGYHLDRNFSKTCLKNDTATDFAAQFLIDNTLIRCPEEYLFIPLLSMIYVSVVLIFSICFLIYLVYKIHNTLSFRPSYAQYFYRNIQDSLSGGLLPFVLGQENHTASTHQIHYKQTISKLIVYVRVPRVLHPSSL